MYHFRKKKAQLQHEEQHTYDVISDEQMKSEKGKEIDGVYSEVETPPTKTGKGKSKFSMSECVAYEPNKTLTRGDPDEVHYEVVNITSQM